MGVAGATTDTRAITLAGLAALIAGALSMAVGEYVSVSSQSDAEKAYIAEEKRDLKENPEYELDELTREYIKHGLSPVLAHEVSVELTKKDALRAHMRMHFSLDPDDINNPWHAATASLLAFSAGGIVPFLTIVLLPVNLRIWATIAAVLVCLLIVGSVSAHVGSASKKHAVIRVVLGGLAAMGVTYIVGVIFGTSVQ
jgi:VIT1/CCC1 family predicted Fe2+/Mn2+ transporter